MPSNDLIESLTECLDVQVSIHPLGYVNVINGPLFTQLLDEP
jgi:hypothetical protein